MDEEAGGAGNRVTPENMSAGEVRLIDC